jgi:alkylation response protein AidB-like acyl-CoA dehydrogenase
MNFDLDESQELFKSTVERFMKDVTVAQRQRVRKMPGGFDPARWKELADAGLIAVTASEDDGGIDGTQTDCAVVARSLGQALCFDPWLECGFLPAKLLAGTEYCGLVVTGELLCAFAFAEPGQRYVLNAETTTAKITGESVLLTGEKNFVLYGAIASHFIVTAKLDDRTELFLLERTAQGVTIKEYPVADGGVAVVLSVHNSPAVALPGGEERLHAVIDEARIGAAAEMVGITQKLFDDTLEYVRTREQFGQPIGKFQVIQHKMVDCYDRLEQMQSGLLRLLLVPAADRSAQIEGFKAMIGENAHWIAHQAVQFHGGMGMSDDLNIGHGLKRIVMLSRLFGDPQSGYARFSKAAG